MKNICIPFLALALSAYSTSRKQHHAITDFTFPWSDKSAPQTRCDLHTTQNDLIVSFSVEDRDLIISDTWAGESTLDGEDRVEIFFTAKDDEELKNYWCIEIDPLGRVHDYHAQHYREFNHAWNCPGLQPTARRTAKGYEVTARIPLKTMSDLLGQPITRGGEIRLGLFRADFYGKDKATHGEACDNWLSWIRPESKQPDFHIPSAMKLWKLP